MEKEMRVDGLVEKNDELTLEYQAQGKYQTVNNIHKPVGEGLWLRVYVDEEHKRYFIDLFAAYSLRMISYQEACARFDRGEKYFEISLETLRKLEIMFKNRIKYLKIIMTNNNFDYQDGKKNEFNVENFDNYDDKKYFGDEEINNYKQAFPENFNNRIL